MLFGGSEREIAGSCENMEKMYTLAGECFGRTARMFRRLSRGAQTKGPSVFDDKPSLAEMIRNNSLVGIHGEDMSEIMEIRRTQRPRT